MGVLFFLIIAAKEGFVDVARLLLKEGALVNGADSRKCTPLHYATAHNQGAMVDLLLAHGASPDIPDDLGELPLHVAASYYYVAILEAFIRATHIDDSSTDEPRDPAPRSITPPTVAIAPFSVCCSSTAPFLICVTSLAIRHCISLPGMAITKLSANC